MTVLISQVTTEGIRCVSKVSQLKKRKATQPLEAPSAKRTRCDELLATLQDFQKVQAAQLQSLQLLAVKQCRPQPSQVLSRVPPSLEEAFAAFVTSFQAIKPAERQIRMNTIKSNITDETATLVYEMFSLLTNSRSDSSEAEILSTTDESESFDSENSYLWYGTRSPFFMGNGPSESVSNLSPQEWGLVAFQSL